VGAAKEEPPARLLSASEPMSPVLSRDGKHLFMCERFKDEVIAVDAVSGHEVRRIRTRREPVALRVTPDGSRLLVANHLPRGRADGTHMATTIGVIDTGRLEMVNDLWLPNGSALVNEIGISPDGSHAVATHVLARFWHEATKVDRGWLFANAMTVIDLRRMEVVGTVLLDEVGRGAANPWGVAWSQDGRALIITHAGTHEVSVVDFPDICARIEALAPQASQGVGAYGTLLGASSDASADVSFLGRSRMRVKLGDDDVGPRAAAVVANRAYIANYFSDTLSVIDLARDFRTTSVPLGGGRRMTQERLGEMYFNDGRICREGWQSCASCHPGDGRVDAFNWDLPNDGFGNPKNTKSLLYAHGTPPVMSLGQRETAESAVRIGIRKILFSEQPPAVAVAIDAYLKSLKPLVSPHRTGGELSAAAERGRLIFNSDVTGCAKCHPPPMFTDQKQYDVGTRGPRDRTTDVFDTPTLVELWRTGPYLHDGSVVDPRDLFTFRNEGDTHGVTSRLTADEIRDLCAYILSL